MSRTHCLHHRLSLRTTDPEFPSPISTLQDKPTYLFSYESLHIPPTHTQYSPTYLHTYTSIVTNPILLSNQPPSPSLSSALPSVSPPENNHTTPKPAEAKASLPRAPLYALHRSTSDISSPAVSLRVVDTLLPGFPAEKSGTDPAATSLALFVPVA